MADEWWMLCQTEDIIVENLHVNVKFGDDRRHRVTINEEDDAYVPSALVVGQAMAQSLPNLAMQASLWNRTTSLVGFRIDKRGRLIGEAWVPKAGLDASEFQCLCAPWLLNASGLNTCLPAECETYRR